MMNNKIIVALLLPVLLCGCTRKQVLSSSSIPLVKNILDDQTGRAQGILQIPGEFDSYADICIVGAPDRAFALAEKFRIDDYRDNITGELKRDSLPDFSGEKFSCILDSANVGYSRLLEQGDGTKLREVAVHQCMMALDTICHLSPYDKEGLGRKWTSKIIVLASPFLSAYGKMDVDTLFKSAGVDVPVLGTFDTMCERLFKSMDGNLNVGVISRTEDVDKGIYPLIFQRYAKQYGRTGCTLCEYEAFDTEDPMREFLDNYIQSGHNRPLNAVLVDDYSLDVAQMSRNLKKMTSVMSGESLQYESVIAKNFMIYDGESSVVQWCYRHLRRNNDFTHIIAWPFVEYFHTVPRPGAEDNGIQADFMLIRDKRNVQK